MLLFMFLGHHYYIWWARDCCWLRILLSMQDAATAGVGGPDTPAGRRLAACRGRAPEIVSGNSAAQVGRL